MKSKKWGKMFDGGCERNVLGDVSLLKLLCASREEVATCRSTVEVGGGVVCK